MHITFNKTLLVELDFKKSIGRKSYKEICSLILYCWEGCLNLVYADSYVNEFYLLNATKNSFDFKSSFYIENLFAKDDVETFASYMYYHNPKFVTNFTVNSRFVI